jgi:regulator of sigma E protease
MIVLTILAVVLIFGFLIFVHELGHYVAARRSGVEVEEFGFGFPPRLVGKQVGRTIYSINWIPLGGFVKLKGETLTDKTPGSFGATSFWGKTKILFAGVTMNALTAFAILWGLCLTGLPPLVHNQFSFGHSTFAQPKQVMVLAVGKDSPADKAGIKKGDVVLAADGKLLESEQQLIDLTRQKAGEEVSFLISVPARGGQRADVHAMYIKLNSPDSKEGFLGVSPMQTYKLRYVLGDAFVTAVGLTLQMMWLTLAAFGSLLVGLFMHAQVGDQVAGPVGIVVILANILELGLPYVLIFVASISISLAVINALPLPALDGGRWTLAAVQRVTNKQLSERTENMVHLAGFAALILLMLVVTIYDIKRLG